ncbi:oxalate:formate antiporter-like isoform X2 [Liolophura sinensis]|uniref:oxalate:formate antiporter-like isoform X2 n=1 Tax=Liolophura sinensis TaxID=3198878 RepID=UPI00315919F5
MVALKAAGVVIGGILVHLTLGTIYTFGNMTPYFTSYMRQNNVSDVTYGDSVWIFASSAVGQGTSMTFGGFLEQRIGTRASVLTGAWLASLGVLLTFFSIKQSFVLTMITYGLMFGLGVGIAYAIPMACAMRWLPKYKGLVNGMVVAGFGGGAFIFDYVQTGFINPRNLKASLNVAGENYFDEARVLDKVPYCFLLLGGIYAALSLIGVLLLQNPPDWNIEENIIAEEERKGIERSINYEEKAGLLDNEVYDRPEMGKNPQHITGDLETERRKGGASISGGEDSSGLELSPKQVLKNPNFYKLWLIFLCNGTLIVFVSTLYKAYGQTFIQDDLFLAIVGAFAAVFNASGRIMWGRLSDRFSFRIAMMVLCCCMTALMLTLQITSLAGKAMYFVWVCAIFLTFSGNFSLFPTAASRSFGQKNMVKNYGLVFTSQVIASPIGAVLSSQLKDVLGWSGMFFFLAGLSVLSLIITFTFRVKRMDGRRDI